jgi:hypothetical protein
MNWHWIDYKGDEHDFDPIDDGYPYDQILAIALEDTIIYLKYARIFGRFTITCDGQ